MRLTTRGVTVFSVAALLAGSLVLAGCSSSPDEEEMKRLNDLKAETAQLEKDVAAKEQQKAALDQQLAEKNAKLKKCADDQQIVKQRLAK